MSHLRPFTDATVDRVRIIIQGVCDVQDNEPVFECWLTASQQKTVHLRTLLQTYCAERSLDPNKYSLCLHTDILFANATIDTLSKEYNMPRTGELSMTLTAVPLAPPCPQTESSFGVRRMSYNAVRDHSTAFDCLSRAHAGTIDTFALASVVAQTESAIEREKYRHMSEDKRHDRILDSIMASPHFKSLGNGDAASAPRTCVFPAGEISEFSARHPHSAAVRAQCKLAGPMQTNDLNTCPESDEDDDYESDDTHDMHPMYTEHAKTFMAKHAAALA